METIGRTELLRRRAHSHALSRQARLDGAPAAAEPAEDAPAEAEAIRLELTALAAEVPAPSRDEVRAAYAAAGLSPDVVEVSQDSTPTGLAVDSIVSAAALGEDCVLAEIRSGTATVTVVPALANGACLLGDDR